MKKTFAAVAAIIVPVLVACSSAPVDEQTGNTDQAVKVCPYAIPYCDTSAGCKLVGGCPEQCVCDNGQSTLCGTQHCGASQYCCDSTTAGYECLPIGYMCPL